MTALVAAERGIGETALVDALPDFVVVVFAAVTHLADPWFLFGLLAVATGSPTRPVRGRAAPRRGA
ncbi:phosphoesterase, partial [Halorubrum saccharovorum]